MIHFELIVVCNIRVKVYFFPHRYPSSCVSTVTDPFELGSSKGPSAWGCKETKCSSEAKESLIVSSKNGEVQARPLESMLFPKGYGWGCFIGFLSVGGGHNSPEPGGVLASSGQSSCTAHAPDGSALHSVSAHGLQPPS